MKYFTPAIVALIIGLILGGVNGYAHVHTVDAIMAGITAVIILAALESSQSMDNSIIAAGILKAMPPKWQERYKTWGFIVAGLGMRFAFPIIVVSVMLFMNPIQVLSMAMMHPDKYSKTLLGVDPEIMSFGGAFLLMLSSMSLFNHEKDTHWIVCEEWLTKLAANKYVTIFMSLFVTVLTLVLTVANTRPEHAKGILISGFAGIVSYGLVQALGSAIGDPESKSGRCAASFWYLEAIDASFSFDGVISAFAVSTDVVTILIGLSIGALFVRCLTIANVKTGFMADLPYLENGAYISIFILSLLMFVKDVGVNVPDVATGMIGIVIIGASFWSSIKESKEATS